MIVMCAAKSGVIVVLVLISEVVGMPVPRQIHPMSVIARITSQRGPR